MKCSLINPAYPGYFADPSVFRAQASYFAVGTSPTASNDGLIFSMLQSTDFVTWKLLGGALEHPGQALGTDFWAPEIAYSDGYYHLFYSVGFQDKGHQLRVATSKTPTGPYRDVGSPVLDPSTCSFAIDAHPFRDDDGTWYLFYARDMLDTERPGTSLVASRLHGMREVDTEYLVIGRASHDWQRFESHRTIYGGSYDWHTLEGPWVEKRNGVYYCFYSGGNWQNETYGVDYFSSHNVLGPYKDDNPGDGPRILRTQPGRVLGPGHNSVVAAPNGRSDYIAYHAWDIDRTARRLCFDVLEWTSQGPQCSGPTWEAKAVDW